MQAGTGRKVYEKLVRRMATRQGLALKKNRRRDPRALDYGLYSLVRANEDVQPTGPTGDYRSLDDVYAALNWDPRSDVRNGDMNTSQNK